MFGVDELDEQLSDAASKFCERHGRRTPDVSEQLCSVLVFSVSVCVCVCVYMLNTWIEVA